MWEERPKTANTASTPHVAVIGRNMIIIGKVQSSEDLYVDGEVRGSLDVENCRLTIGPNGKANAGAKAREVEVMGRIDGDVETVEKISIRKGGELVGDIRAAGIVIEDGAYFKGSIDIIRRPAVEPVPKPASDSEKLEEEWLTREFWEGLVGSTVCGRYLLAELVGAAADSAVYRTSLGVGSAALKLASTEGEAAEPPRLEHEHVVRLFESGICEVGQSPFRYFLTEFADESLGPVLAERALTPGEAKGMLGPVLEALAYLHGRGLSHGRVKPKNILAVGDSVKLSVDSIGPANPVVSAGEDMRALGLTIIEVLTQERRPSRIGSVPQPFLDIVEHALLLDPAARWTARQAAVRLSGGVPVEQPRPTSVVDPVAAVAPAPKEKTRLRTAYVAAALLFFGVLVSALVRNIGSPSGSPLPEPRVVSAAPIPPKPAAFDPAPKPVAKPAPDPAGHGWFVVVATYAQQADASHQAGLMARRWPQFKPGVFPPSALDSNYLVIIGSGLTEDRAESLRERALASGLPHDTYIKKYPSSRPPSR